MLLVHFFEFTISNFCGNELSTFDLPCFTNRERLTGVYELSPSRDTILDEWGPFVEKKERHLHCRMLTGPGFYHWP